MRRAVPFIVAFLAGCGLPNESTLPPLCIEEEWKADTSLLNVSEMDEWWHLFQDPCLDELMEEALESNPDLWIACERIQEARAIEGIAFSYRLPSVDLTPAYTRQGILFNTGSVGESLGLKRVIQDDYSFPLNLSYEADFWGKFCYADKAAQERLIATEFGYLSVLNILTSEVARVYFRLRTFDEEIGFLQETVAIRNLLVDINKKRVAGGLDPEVDLERARLEVYLAEADLVNSERLRALAENELAVLLGEQASTFCLPRGRLSCAEVNPCPGLPSELLLRRPDLNEQYRKIRASLFEVGVANANFFPSILMTGAFGTVSPELSNWFTWQSRFWSFAFAAVQTIFDGGALINEKKLALARFHKEKAIYQKAVYTAFGEVEDALSDVYYRNEQLKVQERAVFHASETAYLARQQYDGGLINYLQVADAEKTELNTKRLAIQLKGSRYQASVALFKALGGGYTTCGE